MHEALHEAIDADDPERVRALLLERAQPLRRDTGLGAHSDLSTLQLAALYAPEAAPLLLRRGVACDLHSACALGRTDDVRALVAADAAELTALAEGLTPLAVAIVQGQAEAVHCLLALGDDPNRAVPRAAFYAWEVAAQRRGAGRWTPLHLAALHGYHETGPEMIDALRAAGADATRASTLGALAVHLAAAHGWTEQLDRLLAPGDDVDARTEPVAHEVWDLAGAPPHAELSHAQTALHVAAREGQVDVARGLLERGADVHAEDSGRATPLHLAAYPFWGASPELVRLLLASGADPARRDRLGRSPLDLARAAGGGETAALLGGSR
ncbi:MAG: ankyrin repeat domain-containing protein [Planctomycetota bacterium]